MQENKIDTQRNINKLFKKYLRLSNFAFYFYILFFITFFIYRYTNLSAEINIILLIICGISIFLFALLFLVSFKHRFLLCKKMGQEIEYGDQLGFWLIGIFTYPIWHFYYKNKIGKGVKKYILAQLDAN